MNRHLIKYRLALLGLTQRDIAERLKVSNSTVSMVLAGFTRSANVEELVAELLNEPLHRVWPKWYRPDGRRVRNRPCNAESTLAEARRELTQKTAAGKAAA